MAFFLYTVDSTNNKPKISAVDSADVVLRDGSVALNADWTVGAYNIKSTIDPTDGNSLTRKSWVETQLTALTGPFGAKNKFVGEANGADPASVSIGSRFLVTSGYTSASAGAVVVGDVIEQDSADPTFTKITKTDGDVYVASTQLANSAGATSDSSVIDDGEITVWDSSTGKFVTCGSIIAIPDAVSGSGGSTKGKVTADEDKGLLISSGILEVKLNSEYLEFVTGSLSIKESGITHNQLGGLDDGDYKHLTATNYTDLTDAGDSALHYHATDRNRANHTGTQAASTISDFAEAARDAAGLALETGSHTAIDFTNDDGNDRINGAVKYDNSSIGVNGSNQLEVKDDGITAAKLGNVVTANEGVKQNAGGDLAVDYDNVTIGIVANKLAVLNSGEVSLTYTNNTGGQLDAGDLVALSTTVAGEIVLANANDADLADAEGVVKANIADAASGKVVVKGDVSVNTDGNDLDLGKWVYVAGGASAGKATKIVTGSYYQVKLGRATATNKVSIDKQWIG